jgi:hypothetical protein
MATEPDYYIVTYETAALAFNCERFQEFCQHYFA